MDFIKQYIIQSITAASGNLRLSNQRLEVIVMLKKAIQNSKDVQSDLNQMKKITELSKFAIKLSEIHHYLSEGIDFLKISDKFKEHSFNLIKELNYVLDVVEPSSLNQKLEQINIPEKKVVELVIESETSQSKNESKSIDNLIVSGKSEIIQTENSSGQKLASLDKDENKDNTKGKETVNSFNGFESSILNPIKAIDAMLNQLSVDIEVPLEVEEYSRQMNVNSKLASENGFEILAQMHEILSKGLMYLTNKTLVPSKEVIESLRACLIVIVAVVKSKEVDVRNYHNRAEVFGKFLQKIKTEETK